METEMKMKEREVENKAKILTDAREMMDVR